MLIQIYLASDITLSSQTDLINCFIDKFSLVHITKNTRTCYASKVRRNFSILFLLLRIWATFRKYLFWYYISELPFIVKTAVVVFFFIYKKLHCLFYITKWNYENLFSNCKYAFEWLFLILKKTESERKISTWCQQDKTR